MKLIIAIIIVLVLTGTSCSDNKTANQDKTVAKVFDKYLYISDLEGVFPQNISKDDSITIARNYINTWVKKQLMLRKAEINLSDENKDIQKEIDDYRSSLLIFRYKQELIRQKIDTVVTDSEIRNYYNEFSGNFILNQNILKSTFIKVSKQAPDLPRLKQWFRSDDPDNLLKIDEYCYQYASKYHSFNNEWIFFSDLQKEVPLKTDLEDQIIKYQKYVEVDDSLFIYLVKINEYALKSNVQPLEYAQLKIKSIILNKRKFSFLEEIENDIFNDALDRNEFVIY
ncbi:MAG: hypothetical protein A2W99_06885 [Bacteroidetes bacterium GWF2_33_16]|nr:MAG: hypothetical protein A2X00_07010 [Bacteroidetes bacterium GWE2_32_14]OFY02780.1 MAG: hypothetical protein A2W99_06885 [Bacteroidetes bacterium GWF2_33_16]